MLTTLFQQELSDTGKVMQDLYIRFGLYKTTSVVCSGGCLSAFFLKAKQFAIGKPQRLI